MNCFFILEKHANKIMKLLYFILICAGPRDHPDIAESFMLLHAQVGWPSSTALQCRLHRKKIDNNHLSVHIIRLLNGSLTCTCRISWMLNLCFTAVGVFFLCFCSFLEPVTIFSKLNLYFAPPGILSLKFPETPTVKAASFFFVGWRWNVQISDFVLSHWCVNLCSFSSGLADRAAVWMQRHPSTGWGVAPGWEPADRDNPTGE